MTADLATRGEMPLDQPKTLATVEASPMEILRDMVARGASPDAIEKISALAERWDDRAREATYMKAMNACQSELPAVSKDTFREDTKSWYAKLETIAKTITATAHKHGFSLSYGTADCPRGGQWLRFTLDVMHIGGHSRQYLFDVPVDNVGPNGKANKSESHGTISSNTIAKKMLLCNAFNVTLQGMEDATGTPSEHISLNDRLLLNGLLDQCGEKEWPPFLKYATKLHGRPVESLDQIDTNHFAVLHAKLTERVAVLAAEKK